jgi:hypothetical protein
MVDTQIHAPQYLFGASPARMAAQCRVRAKLSTRIAIAAAACLAGADTL